MDVILLERISRLGVVGGDSLQIHAGGEAFSWPVSELRAAWGDSSATVGEPPAPPAAPPAAPAPNAPPTRGRRLLRSEPAPMVPW